MDLGLEGKVAVVGGASRGLGRACALGLAREGALVALCSRTAKALESTAQEISPETGGQVVAFPSDLSTLQGVKTLIARTVDHFGGLDIAVNNSGGPPAGTAEGADEASWEQAVQISLYFFARMSREVVPHMRARVEGASSTSWPARSSNQSRTWCSRPPPDSAPWATRRPSPTRWPRTAYWSTTLSPATSSPTA